MTRMMILVKRREEKMLSPSLNIHGKEQTEINLTRRFWERFLTSFVRKCSYKQAHNLSWLAYPGTSPHIYLFPNHLLLCSILSLSMVSYKLLELFNCQWIVSYY